jgi:hypothetical protein
MNEDKLGSRSEVMLHVAPVSITAIIVIAFVVSVSSAFADRRVALVIGNNEW